MVDSSELDLKALSFDTPVAVIGDIHGMLDRLNKLVAELPAGIPILVLGDLCDRGPDTKAVIDRLIELKAQGVYGNHEEWFRDWACRHFFDSFALADIMGGRATLDSYGVSFKTTSDIEKQYLKVPREQAAWVNSLSMVIDLTVMGRKYWLTHAGLPVNDHIGSTTEGNRLELGMTRYGYEMLWGSNQPRRQHQTGRTLLMGHLIQMQPLDAGHVIAIDTGCGTLRQEATIFDTVQKGPVRAGRLTACILPERKFITVG